MKPFDLADIIYAATGISAKQFPDEYKGILAACEMAVTRVVWIMEIGCLLIRLQARRCHQ